MQAFQYSCIIVDLCVLEPSIGNMLKGLVYSTCPYAIPKVKFDSDGVDDDTYKCKIGMKPGETLKQFTTRMTVSSWRCCLWLGICFVSYITRFPNHNLFRISW